MYYLQELYKVAKPCTFFPREYQTRKSSCIRTIFKCQWVKNKIYSEQKNNLAIFSIFFTLIFTFTWILFSGNSSGESVLLAKLTVNRNLRSFYSL